MGESFHIMPGGTALIYFDHLWSILIMIDYAVKIFWVELCWTPLKFCWRIKQNRNNRIALIIIYRLIMFALQTRIESSAEGCWGTNLNERGRQKKCWSACWCNSSGYIVFTHDAHMYPWHSYICTTIPSPMVHIHYLIQRNLSFFAWWLETP